MTFPIDGDLYVTGKTGLGIEQPQERLEVDGKIKTTDLQASGTVQALSFQGDGSNLTGVIKNLDSVVKKAGDIMAGPLTIQDNLTVNGNFRINQGTQSSFGSHLYLSKTDGSPGRGQWHINIAPNNALNFVESGIADYRLAITPGGNVGIGTPTPGTPLEIVSTQDSILRLRQNESGHPWNYIEWWNMSSRLWWSGTTPSNTFAIGTYLGGGTVLSLSTNGNVIGKFVQSSSKELKENIGLLCLQEAAQILAGLNPVKFNYKTDSDQHQNIGFIAEDVPELLATSDRKGVSIMDIVGVLTKVLQEQQKTILELAEKVKSLEAKIPNCDLG
ncbi:tail fiber domain-containing protein [Microcystis aeruginosa]|uniref:Peptidase S74 domain-containing protein n=1 Tax=Microcystis aeruginosa FD4 TaxID=2686288 RepID=A0A857D417_MICAE|nr:tail fiber domain-containing protein [Microcystis aeruginosa]QGZ90588.1 hypothetical protein GQR42_14750 [Microcystis aeruginosa FD4]